MPPTAPEVPGSTSMNMVRAYAAACPVPIIEAGLGMCAAFESIGAVLRIALAG